jgi:Zinc carboxypeptidase
LFSAKNLYFIDMKRVLPGLFFIFLHLSTMNAQSPKEFAEIWTKSHVTGILPSNTRHKDLLVYLGKLKKLGIKVSEVGKSYGGREIFQAEWGKGQLKIFMWSQMHGDEPTATPALIDLLAFLQTSRLAWVKRLSQTITIHAVPMLNPDGTELFQRRNLQFIDINRDARRLETPEGQLLKKLCDDWKPNLGFNLHNQNSLTTVGNTKKQATISLLAVSGDKEGKSNEGHLLTRRLCSVMVKSLETFIKGNIGRYDDEYNERAFGDNISAWGTPVILVETGAMHGKSEMFLVKLNFVAYLSALQSIVDGTEKQTSMSVYDNLPFNSTGDIYNFIFRKATIVGDKGEPYSADVGVNSERRRANEYSPAFVQEIGDLSVYAGLEEFDVKDYYLVPKGDFLRIGSNAEFSFYKKSSVKDLKKLPEPDAIFLNGKWKKPLP